MKLHLVRHPVPMLGRSHCYGGSDVAVAAEELARCCDDLALRLPRGAPILSSPLRRCADLAQALAARLGAPGPAFEPDLREMDFGSWELRAWDDIPWVEVEAWNRDLAHHAPGGGESLLQMTRRVRAVFDGLRRAGAPESIIVCHGGPIRLLRACVAWQDRHGARASADQAALKAIALDAAGDRRELGFGALITLETAPF